MTIAYVGSGTLAQGTTTVTPGLPSGTAAGQLAVLQVVSGSAADSIPGTPAGWALVDSFSGGGGTFGSGTGPRRLTWFTRVLAGGDTAPTVTLAAGTGNVLAAQAFALSRSGGTGWRWATVFGEDTTSGTGFSALSPGSPTWAAGDFAVIGYGIAAGGASVTASAVSAAGITFGTVTERADVQLTSGDLGRSVTSTSSVTAGAAASAPTVTATLATASTGVAGVLRVRQATAVLAATAQTAFPPRTLLAVTGMTAEDTATVTLLRQVGTAQVAVRAATEVDVGGDDALLRVDAEMPLGVPVSYAAELTDVSGATWALTAGPLTTTVEGDVISDAVTGLGAAVTIESPLDRSRTRAATQFNVGGRLVTVGKRRSGYTATVVVRTETDADHDALDQVLQQATEGVVLLRKDVSLTRLDGYLAVTDDTERPRWYDEICWWDLTATQAEAWPDVLEAAGFTLQDIADAYATLADIAAAFPDLLSIALFDFGA